MKYIKKFEDKDKKFKIGDYVRVVKWRWTGKAPGDWEKYLSDEIYKISDFDGSYEISDEYGTVIDWNSSSDLEKVSKYELEKRKYNL